MPSRLPAAPAAALLLLALAAGRAHAQFGGPSDRPLRIGISGGVAVPVGDFKDGFQQGALRRDLQAGLAAQGFVEVRAPGTPFGFRAAVGYNRFGVGRVTTGTTGAELTGAGGSSQVLAGIGNVTLQFPAGPIRPYILAGLGAFRVQNTLTDAGTGAAAGEVSETNFGINGGAGLQLRLGPIDGFLEARLANVYTKQERFGNLKNVQYVPVTFGVLF
jgi:hypothetical protein